MKVFVALFLTSFCVLHHCYATEISKSSDFKTTEEILALAHAEHPTTCASKLFLEALVEHSNEIDENETEYKVRAWAHETMTGNKDVLTEVLKCPELQNIADDTTIVFSPLEYSFPNGRTITINYSTQPKVLKQKLILANKRSLPDGNANPDLTDILSGAKYLNTEPAWYGIMVVQHDSLKDFVGADKNNTLSVKYLNDHIKEIYPKGYSCTSKSAWANDTDTINQVVHKVVNIENDSNDYYVAGDVNLEWVMYAEIAAEVILTVATAGAGEAGMAALKGVRATKTANNLRKSMQVLKKSNDVAKYLEKTRAITRHTNDIAKLEKEIKSLKNTEEIAKKRDEIKKLQESVKTLEKDAKELEKTSKEVKQYKETAESYVDVVKYRRSLRSILRPQTGNVIVRSLRTIKAANTGAKTMTKAAKVARAGMSSRSTKLKYWLTDATLKHGARLARFERDAGLLYGAITFLGDMYDKTSTTSKEFSNGIEFKPLCLLSADDLEGQENVVNYGMWLMWVGNSEDAADDDAAYLQAMDFASKFFYQLDEFQDEHGANCNVDIYVVRPIIRLDETNLNDPKGELFYLFMNEIPWSTAEQFGDQVPNIEDWERAQSTLEQQDPNNKYKKQKTEDSAKIQEQVAATESLSSELNYLDE